MYKYLLVSLTALIASSSYSQPEIQKYSLPVVCSSTEVVVSTLVNDYKEEPIWAAKEEIGIVVTLWTNKRAKTFTITKTDIGKKITCIISAGDQSRPEV